MAQGQGCQPINITVVLEMRDEERRALHNHFLKNDGIIDEDEAEVLAIHDRVDHTLEQALHCIWTGMSWFRCLTPQGNRRTRDLTAQYVGRYSEPIAAD